METIDCESKLLEKLKEDIKEVGDVDDVVNENDILKRIISCHPLYSLLLESHINCLQVGGIGQFEIMKESKYLMKQELNMRNSTGMLGHSELDHFMVAYCYALGKLKEAIEEPQQKSMAFITKMHSQLSDLTRPNPPAEPITSLMSLMSRGRQSVSATQLKI